MTTISTPPEPAKNNQPLALLDVMRACTEPGTTVDAVVRRLGPAMLVGYLPTELASESRWWFRTRPVLMPTPEAAENEGLSLDMFAWPLIHRGLGAVLRGSLRVGRAPSNDVWLDDPSISKLHARITVTPQGTFIVDAGSQHGTEIHGVRLRSDQPGILRDMDSLVLGRMQLRYVRTETLFRLLGEGTLARRAG